MTSSDVGDDDEEDEEEKLDSEDSESLMLEFIFTSKGSTTTGCDINYCWK